ncbi:MAG: nucleoside deaminase [Alphaproteobacteria bacterium]|jgi:tRNA(Arg) A34 adenosine deaminase TadA|nr:nucleoside deaminase [Alphaproteobacteria bacterium]MBT5389804.1 nucleoside deaminase [Alphaproteobacteria bacterium]MBT5540130.1 nucleoside deaminase [Alphaproteobacteria bacterium]MBT5654022.1 nucleoside deaminase [Alphaproteobacteria bacterium]
MSTIRNIKDLNQIQLGLPPWITEIKVPEASKFQEQEERMRFVIMLSKMNVDHGTGGPFGAAIFNMKTHELVSMGVNVVISEKCSMAHAEIMALMLAQKKLGKFSLNLSQQNSYELVTSSEPCAMCFGAILWSGVKCCSSGARAEDVSEIGFDEGDKPSRWNESLEKRGITLIEDVCRQEAKDVLEFYVEKNGRIYNG